MQRNMSYIKGCAELLYLDNTDMKIGKGGLQPNDLNHKMYKQILPSPVPLQEIDSPYDLYVMFSSGALLIKDFLSDKNTKISDENLLEDFKENLVELPRKPDIGDVVLVHYPEKKLTKVILLVGTTTYNAVTMKFYRASKLPNYDLCMLDLNDHRGFQHVW